MLKTIPVYLCGPGVLINGTSSHSQTCSSLDNKFHGYLELKSEHMHRRNTFHIAVENMGALDSVLLVRSYTSYYRSEPWCQCYKLGDKSIPLKYRVKIQKDKVYESAL